MKGNPAAYNYFFETIPNYDRTIDNLSKIYELIITTWWLDFLNL